MKTMKIISVELNEDFIQDLKENAIEPQRAELRKYDNIRVTSDTIKKIVKEGGE